MTDDFYKKSRILRYFFLYLFTKKKKKWKKTLISCEFFSYIESVQLV